ncbi:helix-turn-helix domain-containing protein [Moheibacter lacus]|uniref:Helix-turn-helix domain-containing protein n=1 Tax=Moheibacter lacus TaxID=2745851 RepID=A0A838ZU31_9FLAO|nr:helix-turn-helix domain-containing protein [Moheibacter lacus]MBA5630500.1 helix-turn-helix domain-containing protein [Moheibacter lacus]
MPRTFLLYFLALGFLAKAQNAEKFDAIFNKTFMEVAQNNFNKALENADSLYQISETPYFKTKSLMLTATLYQQSGDLNQSIAYALKSEKIITETTNYTWITRVYGFLATQYRLLGLFTESKKYGDLAFETAKKIEDKSRISTVAMILQELAIREFDQKNYKAAIRYLNEAKSYLKEVQQNQAYLIAQNEQWLGDCYVRLNEFENALKYFQSSRKIYCDLPDNYVKGLIFDGMAFSYLSKEEFGLAKIYLDSAKAIADQSNYLELKNRVLNTSEAYYLATKDLENISLTKQEKDAISNQIDDKKLLFVDGLLAKINQENTVIKEEVHFKTRILFVSIALLICALAYFIFYRIQQQKNINRIKKIITELELKNIVYKETRLEDLTSLQSEESSLEAEIPQEPTFMMNPETEEKLIQKLEDFESTTLFTENAISLSSLAIYCETNTKYLSYIINTYKKQDFYNYINELRINYIINQLNQNPLYRKYKIATLAEEAGFSSQNKFATVFKKVTSISPSVFIKYLEEEKIELNA